MNVASFLSLSASKRFAHFAFSRSCHAGVPAPQSGNDGVGGSVT
jgi:hypothetical protein